MYPIALHDLYVGCMGTGLLYVGGSLLFSGCHIKGHFRNGHGQHSSGHHSAGSNGHAHHSGPGQNGHASAHNGHASANSGHASAHNGHASTHNGHASTHNLGNGVDSGANALSAHKAHLGKASGYADADGNDAAVLPDGNEQLFFVLLKFFNPIALSSFIFFFGAAGLFVQNHAATTENMSLLVAALAGLILSLCMQVFIGWLSARLDSSVAYSVNSAIGSTGEITVSIPQGRTGEVLIRVGQSRRNYPAQAYDPQQEIRRGTRIVVVDVQDGIVRVDQFDV